MNPKPDYDFLFKIVLIGDSGVGKSCMLLRFAEGTFTDNYISTIGVDFKIRTIEIDGKTVKIQIWDTAGQERFRTITSSYYRGADGIIIAYDVTDAESYNHIDTWHTETLKHAKENAIRMLVGTKTDLVHRRVIPEAAAAEKAMANHWDYAETSAKNSVGIDEAFITLSKKLMPMAPLVAKKQESGGINFGNTIKISRKTNCC